MRHQIDGRKLGRTSSHRNAMFRNMVTSLLAKERIRTTRQKAKEVRRIADRMITLGKRGDLQARRQALSFIRDRAVVHKLFESLAARYADRPGGYTRILHLPARPGDNADMAFLELVDRGVGSGRSGAKRGEGKEAKGKTLAGRVRRRAKKTEGAGEGSAGTKAEPKARPGGASKKRSQASDVEAAPKRKSKSSGGKSASDEAKPGEDA